MVITDAVSSCCSIRRRLAASRASRWCFLSRVVMFLHQPHVQRRSSLLQSPLLPACSSPPPPASPPASSRMQLKFGMDRILSGDISPPRRRTIHVSGSPPHLSEHMSSRPPSTGHLIHDEAMRALTPRTCSEGSSGVPCSECVSSLLRCCSVSVATTPPLATPTPTYAFYPSLHHLPPPHHAAPPPHFASMFSSEPAPPPHLMHSQNSKSTSGGNSNSTTAGGKRKRSWSRAVFSNLQRKGLEKRFQLQKYITKPDRRQLAATLGLTDAQVKVWFQNRRMKWRHSKEAKQQQQAATASVTIQQPADSRGPTVLTGDEERRAADSTQRDGVTSDDSDIDIEVDS